MRSNATPGPTMLPSPSVRIVICGNADGGDDGVALSAAATVLPSLPSEIGSSHELPIGLVLGLASIIREQPIEGTFVGLGGHRWGYGTPISRFARAGMASFHATIIEQFALLTGSSPASNPVERSACRPAERLDDRVG
ncbi:MAG: hypothetical protein ABIP77_09650 [Candidatus Limnocylindrales bacterium]